MADVAALRDEIDSLKQQLEECSEALGKSEREGHEIFKRAELALDNAGVPRDVGCTDELEELAARIRWLAGQRPNG